MDLITKRGDHVVLAAMDAQDENTARELAGAQHEVMGAWVVASPRVGAYAMRVYDLFARHTTDAMHLAETLDSFAIWSGQRGWAEEGDLILQFSDSLRDALCRIQDNHDAGASREETES
jgi:hypothetical protein